MILCSVGLHHVSVLVWTRLCEPCLFHASTPNDTHLGSVFFELIVLGVILEDLKCGLAWSSMSIGYSTKAYIGHLSYI
jgi:hypothetical protein